MLPAAEIRPRLPPTLPAACSSLYHSLEGRPGPRAQAKPTEGAEESQEHPPWQQAGAERQNPAHSPTSKHRGVGSKETCRGKRFQRAAEHSNRVQIFEYLRVCGPFLMLLPRNITAFPLALIFIFSFITRCITALSKRERKKADPSVNRSNSNS